MEAKECAVQSTSETRRVRVALRGAVQGVGFRPFVYRLAQELGLAGWVNNSPRGVTIEAEGTASLLHSFLLRLDREKPVHAFYQSFESSWLDPAGYEGFVIRPSESGTPTALVLPDIATCPDCLREIFDPADRRYRYPFTNCTHCGPRFSIIESLPYDRQNTSMRRFPMCPACAQEYHHPADRRFHAQPNACPACGPHLEAWDCAGQIRATHYGALQLAADALRNGKIVALKGLGGFQLLVEASRDEAVERLRQLKQREEKPFAVMAPHLAGARDLCMISEVEERLLCSSEAPIVLLQRRTEPPTGLSAASGGIAPNVAPHNPFLGLMLPYTPLHHLLMAEVGRPLVATSGNVSDEPICIDENEALQRLQGLADLFLVHNRPIVRQVDDSVARIIMGREMVLRRARGYAPLPISLKKPANGILAVGAHLKNTVALSVGSDVFVSQHIGDLETVAADQAFQRIIADFQQIYDQQPARVACDAHPDYRSTQYARRSGLPVTEVQHHYAHILSCMAENEVESPVLGVSWDGTGYGLDGTIWGGEFLIIKGASFQRFAALRTFMLPGGDKAVKEPRRTALGVLYEIFGKEVFQMRELLSVQAFAPSELSVIQSMLERKVNSPRTSSLGRLFDAVSSLAGLRQRIRFEGQAAMELEFALNSPEGERPYPFRIVQTHGTGSEMPGGAGAMIWIDWEPLIWAVLEDARCRVPAWVIAARFHNALAEMVIGISRLVGLDRVVLSGGCFQNRYLTERIVQRLIMDGMRPYWHQRIPPNDGGIALGQVLAACQRM